MNFSEQQVIDCCKTDGLSGCHGGDIAPAMKCLQRDGVLNYGAYPYTGV